MDKNKKYSENQVINILCSIYRIEPSGLIFVLIATTLIITFVILKLVSIGWYTMIYSPLVLVYIVLYFFMARFVGLKKNKDVDVEKVYNGFINTVIKGITSSHSEFHINATTTITLTNGVVINCTGFDYKII